MSRRQYERGILGLPKKKSVLFSFTSRHGEECPSDSEDSDYYPGWRSTDEETEVSLQKKTKKRTLKKNQDTLHSGNPAKKTRLSAEKGKEKSQNFKCDVQIKLPPELLLKIFQFYVASEGVSSVIPKISKVCQAWHDLSQDASLWKRLDLRRELVALTKVRVDCLLDKDLSLCRHLNLSGQTKLQPQVIASLLSLMPGLTSLDLSDCANVKSDLVGKDISRLCPKLERVDISSFRHFNRAISLSALKSLITACGSRLKELRITNVSAVAQYAKELLKTIAENCPNLEELDMRVQEMYVDNFSGYGWKTDIEAFRRGCPLLTELRFDGFNFLEINTTPDRQNLNPGNETPPSILKHLKFYSHCGQRYESHQSPVFYKMFNGVERLKELNISCSNLLPRHITAQVKAIETLNMSGMRWKDVEYPNLLECIDAWGRSIKFLDISRNILTNNIINTALCRYSSLGCEPPLITLNLSATNVTAAGVIKVLTACKQLRTIDLTSCRELPRGTKRMFKQLELKSLLRQLRNHIGDQSDSDTEVADSASEESE